jgi:hypothetical protein
MTHHARLTHKSTIPVMDDLSMALADRGQICLAFCLRSRAKSISLNKRSEGFCPTNKETCRFRQELRGLDGQRPRAQTSVLPPGSARRTWYYTSRSSPHDARVKGDTGSKPWDRNPSTGIRPMIYW